MKTILLLLITLFHIGCRKAETTNDSAKTLSPLAFTTKKEAMDKVREYLKNARVGEQLIDVDNISYIHTPEKTLALIFYQTTRGVENLVIERSKEENREQIWESITVCDGESCACKVTVKIDNMGNVEIGCNCNSCNLITMPQ